MNINLSRESFQVGNNFQGIHHYQILKNQYDLIKQEDVKKKCPLFLRDYFQNEEIIKDCLPPRSDFQSKKGNREASKEVFCLLLEKAGLVPKDLNLDKELLCSLH